MKRIPFSENDDKFIKDNYLTMPIKTIGNAIGRSYCGVKGRMKKMGLVIPAHIVEQRKKDSQIKPGNIPFNKGLHPSEYLNETQMERVRATWYKKGNKPHNTKFDGYERISRDGYVDIRISEGNFKAKHRVKWEEVNGPIPDNHILVCMTKDLQNCDPSNWEMITMEENLRRNNDYDNPTDNRVASYLATSSRQYNKELRDEILNHPELIQAKKNQLLINRKIKNHGKK